MSNNKNNTQLTKLIKVKTVEVKENDEVIQLDFEKDWQTYELIYNSEFYSKLFNNNIYFIDWKIAMCLHMFDGKLSATSISTRLMNTTKKIHPLIKQRITYLEENGFIFKHNDGYQSIINYNKSLIYKDKDIEKKAFDILYSLFETFIYSNEYKEDIINYYMNNKYRIFITVNDNGTYSAKAIDFVLKTYRDGTPATCVSSDNCKSSKESIHSLFCNMKEGINLLLLYGSEDLLPDLNKNYYNETFENYDKRIRNLKNEKLLAFSLTFISILVIIISLLLIYFKPYDELNTLLNYLL